MTQATTIPSLTNPAPARSDPNTFDPRSASFLVDLPTLVDKVNTVVSELNTWNAGTEVDKTSTGVSRTASIASEQAAKTSALASAQRSAVWASGVNYSVGYLVESPITARQYRCIQAGVSTTDPSLDSTRWKVLGFEFNTQYPNIKPTLNLNFAKTKILDPRITFTRNSIGTYFDQYGVMKTAQANQARFDHDPVTGESLGLLIEESRTNLLLNSVTLSTQSVTTSAVAYTLSFYGTGTVTLSGSGTGTLVGSGSFPSRVSLTFTPTAGSLTLTVTGTVQNAQLEVGSFPTSYIPTTSTSVTRQADVAVMQGLNFSSWYSQGEGTIFAEGFIPTNVDGSQANYYVSVSDGTNNNLINITDSNGSRAQIIESGTINFDQIVGSEPTSNIKLALAYQTNNTILYAGGVFGTVDTVVNLPLVDRLTVGMRGDLSQYSATNGCIRRIVYYNKRLSSSELQSITRA